MVHQGIAPPPPRPSAEDRGARCGRRCRRGGPRFLVIAIAMAIIVVAATQVDAG